MPIFCKKKSANILKMIEREHTEWLKMWSDSE